MYSKIYDMDNLRLAHKNASSGKGWYEEVQWIEGNLDYYLGELQKSLMRHTYRTSPYTVFHRKEGKKERKIYKLPYFPDRVAQWALIQVIEPYLLKTFTSDTYSAVPGMGIHKALAKLQKAMYTDKESCQWCLKFDVRHFYQSIDHEILLRCFEGLFKDVDLLWLLSEIIGSVCTADPEDMERLSAWGRKVGVPIGNYLSQYCGNFYLSEFDHWLKEEKGVGHYWRYMDDGVIHGESKERLFSLLRDAKDYLWETRRLMLKGNYQIFPAYVRGVDFVGYRVFDNFTLLRKDTCGRMKKRFSRIGAKGELEYGDFCCYGSYGGWAKWCDSFRLEQKHMMPLKGKIKRYYAKEIKGGKAYEAIGKGEERGNAA